MNSNNVSDSVTRGLAGLFLALQAGCIVLNEEHCLANGGDFACPGQYCLLENGRNVEPRTDALGCTYRPVDDKYHLYLKYGLPAEVKRTEDDRYLDTLEGILVALGEENGIENSCPLNSTVLQEELEEVVDRHAEIDDLRARMEKDGRVRTAPAKLTEDEMKSVDAYNDAVDTWLEACLAKAASEM